MSSQTVNVDLDDENFLWLKSQGITSGRRNLSDTLNAILSRLRNGTADKPDLESSSGVSAKIDESDPDLREADAAIRSLYSRSLDKTAQLFRGSSEEPR